VTTRLAGWLEISQEGFAQRQADRPPSHLIKELIQNALDATDKMSDGRIQIRIEPAKLGRKNMVLVDVSDNGPGVSDPAHLRTVFLTSKTDSFLVRGRLGQGLKEILSMATEAIVQSRTLNIKFHIEKGKYVTDVTPDGSFPGTSVAMWMPWDQDSIPDLLQYVRSLIVPAGREVWLNDQLVGERQAEHTIDVTLRTELFQDGKWVRRERLGKIELVQPLYTEIKEEPMIFEMGIPIQAIDWTQPYHINVQMRVPMNPRRDAVAAGYLKDLYRQVLPVLMPKLEPMQLRDEWVSSAIEDATPEIRREVITAAFGDNAVRSVPTFGRHDYDSDAREIGYTPIDTKLLPRGLREAAQETLRSSQQVEFARREAVTLAFTSSPETDGFGHLKTFVAWLAGQLIGIPVDVRITEDLVIRGQSAAAGWSEGGRLTLNKQCQADWRDPLSERFLGLLVHEVAHERAGHHGDDFRREVERMAGKLALFCLNNPEEIKRRWEGTSRT
jgi:hypothetical protein